MTHPLWFYPRSSLPERCKCGAIEAPAQPIGAQWHHHPEPWLGWNETRKAMLLIADMAAAQHGLPRDRLFAAGMGQLAALAAAPVALAAAAGAEIVIASGTAPISPFAAAVLAEWCLPMFLPLEPAGWSDRPDRVPFAVVDGVAGVASPVPLAGLRLHAAAEGQEQPFEHPLPMAAWFADRGGWALLADAAAEVRVERGAK